MNFKSFYIPRKLTIDFNHINKAAFELLRENEYNKLDRLENGFKIQLKRFINEKVDEDITIYQLKEHVISKNEKMKKRVNNIMEKYELLKKDYLVEELITEENQLDELGFFIKHPLLK